ncbi:YheC/YheD family protein [Clostridium thermosuccinogenes]|uniref:YheC/YheD family endospore coat-associated protein n=1 Tax=Clostridium thermosuccinogenes TaxID=84032 RepID=UPI000CCBF2AA|nr:YheC/YheD family protein [Pseudoclostridium thermosuccinogenes]PNT94227.1 hypothetical protein CDQ83_12335 [Pseudoclostridium thermosuccinogenes]
MSNVFTVKACEDKNAKLVIHPETAEQIGLGRKKFAYACFGSHKYYTDIKRSSEVSEDSILLSHKLMEELRIPDYPVYEVRVNGNEINIGPYIGLLASAKNSNLTEGRLNKMMTYVREYSRVHGAIVVFALDRVDTANRLVEGYCFNPVKDCWQRGVFPYPSAIYRSIGLSEKWKNHFLSVIGDKMFNSRYFSKWEMYQWFSGDMGRYESHINIPYTQLYQSYQDVLDLTEKFGKIYVKPVSGLQGRGVVRISREDGAMVFQYREQGENYRIELKDPDEIIDFITKRFYQGRYLIQQGIDLLRYRGRIIDFRCVVQKDQSGKWVCKAIIGRCGDRESVVSNISSGGTAFPAVEILKRAMSSSEDEVLSMEEKIRDFAVRTCNTLDEYGINCGDLGVDVGIDSQGNLWLIEINNRDPDPTIALNINDWKLYYSLKAGRLYYAKLLAGFGSLE